MGSFVKKNNQVVLIGAGNVATQLSYALEEAGFSIVQIFSRSIQSAQPLAEEFKTGFTTSLKEITTEADLYIFAIKDDALPAVIAAMPANKGIWVHTSGSLPIDLFSGYTDTYGALYPLQTISKQRETDLSKVYFFVEGNTEHVATALFDIADKISGRVRMMTSETRKYLHLAAVFACNFSNHLYVIASQILEKQGIDWHVLLPLIDETAHKLYFMHPEQAQTGPAVRDDLSIMALHQSLIDDERTRHLYEVLSKSIHFQTINKEHINKEHINKEHIIKGQR